MALTRKKFLLAKIEATEGTDSSPVGGSNAIQLTSLEISPMDADVVTADSYQGFLGNSSRNSIVANKRVSVSFDVELSGSGTAGTVPAYDVLLRACGCSVLTIANTSNTYSPTSTSFDSATLYCFYDGTRHVITGARGTFSISLSAGQIPTISFQFTGIYNDPDSTALSGTFTVANQAAALEFNDTNVTTSRVHGVTLARVESMDFAVNNSVIYKETAASKQALIVDRAPGGTIVLEAPDRSVVDHFADARGTSTGSTRITVGDSSNSDHDGNIVSLIIDRTDITGISYVDTNGVISLSMPFVARPTTAGDNSFKLSFS